MKITVNTLRRLIHEAIDWDADYENGGLYWVLTGHDYEPAIFNAEYGEWYLPETDETYGFNEVEDVQRMPPVGSRRYGERHPGRGRAV